MMTHKTTIPSWFHGGNQHVLDEQVVEMSAQKVTEKKTAVRYWAVWQAYPISLGPSGKVAQPTKLIPPIQGRI